MRLFHFVICVAAILALRLPSTGQQSCTRISAYDSVEVGDGEFSLADLLDTACPEIRRAASAIIMGQAPLRGNARVLEGEEIRGLLRKISYKIQPEAELALQLPERITVRRTEAHSSCADLAAALAETVRTSLVSMRSANAATIVLKPEDLVPSRLDCKAAAGVPPGAALEVTKTSWNPRSQLWEFSLRCSRPNDCVPFLVRLHVQPPANQAAGSPPQRPVPIPAIESGLFAFPVFHTAKRVSLVKPWLVVPGQRVTLVWDQAGIRVSLPAICLDRGGSGESVRVRAKNGEKIWRAEVGKDGTLRAIL